MRHGLLNSRASSMIILRMCIGSIVFPPGSPAQLFGERMLYLVKVFARQLLIIFVKSFLQVSRSVMGLVMLILFSHSFFLGIGYTKPLSHCVGTSPETQICSQDASN